MSGPETSPPAPDGALDRAMSAVLGRSWRTQLAGFASLVLGAVTAIGAAAPGVIPANVVAVAGALAPIVAGLGLVVAKDAKVTGLPK